MIETLRNIGLYLAETGLSTTLNATAWAAPLLQTIHIIFVCAVMISMLLVNLRILNVFSKNKSIQFISRHFHPWIWYSLPILLVTGSLLIITEPGRSITNPAFILKMALFITAISLTFLQQLVIRREYEHSETFNTTTIEKYISIFLIACWSSIVFCGRWIAYILSW